MTDSAEEPTTEQLAAQSLQHVQAAARQIAITDGSGLVGAMVITVDEAGVGTVPHFHPEYDSREVSLWMLGAMLAHFDASTPEGTHPLELADHALAMQDEYAEDDRVGWSLEDGDGPRGEP